MSEARASGRRRRFSVDALFTDTSARGSGVSDMLDAKLIRGDRITPDPEQPRKEFNEEALEELAASIRAEGVLQPIAVRYDEHRDEYIIVHGERRWRAAQLAGLDALPAIVRDVPEERRLLQQLAENIVREDLNALERAAALRALKAQMDDAPWEQVAEAVGIRRSRLFQLLSTEKLAAPLQEALRRGVVSEKQTRAAHQLSHEEQAALGTQILDGTRDPRDIARQAQTRRGTGPRARRGDAARSVARASKHMSALQIALEQVSAQIDDLDSAESESLAADLDALQAVIDALRSRLS